MRRPDYIILGGAEGHLVGDPMFLSDLQLSEEPRFLELYEAVEADLGEEAESDSDGSKVFRYYQLKDSSMSDD